MVVQRGEVDWVHIVPAPVWVSHKIVLTKIVMLCRVAHRRQILWSVGNPAESMEWTCKEISPLWDIGTVHQVVVEPRHGWSTSGSQFQGKIEHAGPDH